MIDDTQGFAAERDRLAAELDKLNEEHARIESERAAIAEKIKQSAGDVAAVEKLKIEEEQLAEGKRQNDRLIQLATERFREVERALTMQNQSDII
ncbi:hypothetical protein KHP62_02595 [Rhodobacteraceae bacterium NNCM2]|nr:hypothetical protein [Coraliihabitans acroporae]